VADGSVSANDRVRYAKFKASPDDHQAAENYYAGFRYTCPTEEARRLTEVEVEDEDETSPGLLYSIGEVSGPVQVAPMVLADFVIQ
jgi:hypothetical protein